ncbi:MAG: hypothetical protein M3437_15655 [Chloroflexota bacterium]|nr:hypothetical protein [Chloroflexota bacterium]
MPLRIPARNVVGDQIMKSTQRSGEQIQHVISESGRVVSAEVAVTSFRTIGAAALTQNLFSLENAAGSSLLVAVRRISVQLDATAVLTAVAPSIKVSRITTLPTGGTALGKVPFDSADASNASVVARGATASDGGAATAITATLGTPLWSQLTMRLHTAVGQVLMDDESVIPALSENTPVILRAGQALLVQVVAAATTSNPNTNHWLINAMFEEYTEPA